MQFTLPNVSDSIEKWAQQLKRVGLEIEEIRPYLRRELVSTWDALELLQQIWIAKKRVFGMFWRCLPPFAIDSLANWASQLDIAASPPGGGRLIVARKH